MDRFLLIRNDSRQKDAITGVVSGLGVLAVETAYIVFCFVLGISLFRRGSYYQLFKRAGEEKRISRQAANVLGSLLYILLVLTLLPIIKAVAARLFGG